MLQIEMNRTKTPKPNNAVQYRDIIVKKHKKVVTYDEKGIMTVERIPTLVNISKLVNESKKLIKINTAEEKLAELEKIMSK